MPAAVLTLWRAGPSCRVKSHVAADGAPDTQLTGEGKGREEKETKDWVAPEREVDSDGMGKFNGEAVRALRRMQSPLEIGQCERAKKEPAGLRATAGGTASQSQQHLWWHNHE